MPRGKQKRLILDGDMLAYNAAAAVEKPIKWDEDSWTLHASENDCKAALNSMIRVIQDVVNAKYLVFAITSDKNFRKYVAPSYKSHRAEVRRPMLLTFAKEYLHNLGDVVLYPNLEGDDVIGILMTSPSKYDNYLWSGDKDLKTIPGQHINKDGEVSIVTIDDANKFWMKQTLVGDTSDGYKGCPGSGPKDAEKVLDGLTLLPEMWAAVVKRFEKAGLSEFAALEQARLARILRAEDYAVSTGLVTLWTPEYIYPETAKQDKHRDFKGVYEVNAGLPQALKYEQNETDDEDVTDLVNSLF